jgi:threonine/homoserine/homoserine lactone efflux protein
MPEVDALLLFAAAAVVLLVVPGPAVLYVVVQSAEHGRKAGLASVAGLHLGTFVHTAAAAVGLSALVVSSAVAFSAVKYAGAAYLILLGLRRLIAGDPELPASPPAAPLRRLFLQGVVVNVLNPKTALFFLAFLPQFVDPEAAAAPLQIFLLGLMFVAIALCSDSAWALAAGTLGGWLRRSRWYLGVKRWVTGTVFVALGLSATRA